MFSQIFSFITFQCSGLIKWVDGVKPSIPSLPDNKDPSPTPSSESPSTTTPNLESGAAAEGEVYLSQLFKGGLQKLKKIAPDLTITSKLWAPKTDSSNVEAKVEFNLAELSEGKGLEIFDETPLGDEKLIARVLKKIDTQGRSGEPVLMVEKGEQMRNL
jgi:hypothetical protein